MLFQKSNLRGDDTDFWKRQGGFEEAANQDKTQDCKAGVPQRPPLGRHVLHLGRGVKLGAGMQESFFPSSSWSDAPPRVKKKVILSATPACLTAVTESPPPIIVVAFD